MAGRIESDEIAQRWLGGVSSPTGLAILVLAAICMAGPNRGRPTPVLSTETDFEAFESGRFH